MSWQITAAKSTGQQAKQDQHSEQREHEGIAETQGGIRVGRRRSEDW